MVDELEGVVTAESSCLVGIGNVEEATVMDAVSLGYVGDTSRVGQMTGRSMAKHRGREDANCVLLRVAMRVGLKVDASNGLQHLSEGVGIPVLLNFWILEHAG